MFHTLLKNVTDQAEKAASDLKLRMHFPSISIPDLHQIFIKGEL